MVTPQALERKSRNTPNLRNIDENQTFRYGDLELEWEVNGGSGVPKSMLIKKNNSCTSQDSLINCNEGLDDGDDLFPGTIVDNKIERDELITSSKDNHSISFEQQSLFTRKPTMVSDEPLAEISALADGQKLLTLKGSRTVVDAIVVDEEFHDHHDDVMVEDAYLDRKVKGTRECSGEDSDNDALSTTNNDSGLSSQSTASGANTRIPETDFDNEMSLLYTTANFRSGVASLTPESSDSSLVRNQVLENNLNDNNHGSIIDNTCALNVAEERIAVAVVGSKINENLGRVGLANLGNTCFMNSTVQCLAHTHVLREYFVSGLYKDHLNVNNPLGTGGELATTFAELLVAMWSPRNGLNETSMSAPYSSRYNSSYSFNDNVIYPRDFKYALGRHAEQFIGYDQHDSQELATYLLDALHEDTNRVTKKPYVEKPEQTPHESDEDAAAKSWAIHLQREDSFITRTFVGQVKSKVTCPFDGCERVSTTYDPFMYLSVPIPGTYDITVEVTYVPLDLAQGKRQISTTVPKSFSVRNFLEKLGETVGEAPENLIAADIFKNDVYELFSLSDPVNKLNGTSGVDVYVYQVESVVSIQKIMNDRNIKLDSRSSLRDESLLTGMETYSQDVFTLPITTTQYYDEEYQWTNVLCNHTSDVIFNRLHNVKRSSHQERMEFLAKLQTYLVRQKAKVLNIGQGSAIPHAGMSPLLESMIHHSSSSIFHGAECMTSVLTLQYCGEKFRQWCMMIEADQQKALQNGVIVQVLLQEEMLPGMYTTSRNNQLFATPLIMRIPSSMTVFELRIAIGKRLAVALEPELLQSGELPDVSACSGETSCYHGVTSGRESVTESTKKPKMTSTCELKTSESDFSSMVMKMVPMTCQNTNLSAYTRAHQLGSIEAKDGNSMNQSNVVASSDHPKESVILSDALGQGTGKVFLQLSPRSNIYRFDVKKWNYVAPCPQRDKMHNADVRSRTNLSMCIEKYCQKEQLEDSEMWFCNRCKTHVRAWKHIHLYRTPPVLIIHLKRFHYSSSTHHRDKIDVLVDFPLKGLDLTDVVLHREGDDKVIYDCFAVSNHYGGLGGGHYTAYALNHGQWFHFDDSRVTLVDESAVVSKAAYVLYYCRREQSKPPDTSDARLALSSDFSNYSFSPVSITTADASSRESLDELLDLPYRNEGSEFAV